MTQVDLQATASLAHLDLSEEEVAAALPAFERMLGYFAAMRAADEDEALHSSSVSDLSSHFKAALRADVNNNNNNPSNNSSNNPPNNDLPNALLNCASEREDRFLVVPNVL